MKLTNNTILITGGTSGIGLGLAQSLDQLGNQIIVLARNADKMAAVKAAHPTFATFQADVNDVEILKGLPAWIRGHYPDLNMVINSAGVMRAHDLLDPNVTVEDLFADIDINLKGTVAVDKLLLPQLIHQKESLVVNVSSGLANLSSAAHPTYSASKAGVHMFTSALRDQLRFAQLDHVHVMELVPPLVSETNLESGSHGGRGDMKLADLVQAALKGMAGDKGRVNAGAAKMLRKAGQLRPDQTEWQFAKTSLAQYFPAGLVK